MGPATSSVTKPRILFVEDEATLRTHLVEVLSDDYEVDGAASGTEALLAIMRAKPDLIVTDLVMPGMDGVELLKTLRAEPSTQPIPVLLISGRAPEMQRIAGFKEGADGYLAKPCSEQELRAVIGSMLRAAQHRQQVARREALEQAERAAATDRAALLESITDAFYALDRQWRFTYINQRALDYYGKTREELLGRCIWDVFPVAKASLFQQLYERALETQSSAAFESISPLTGRWIEVRAYPTRQGLAVYFRDVSDRKRAEALSECQRLALQMLAEGAALEEVLGYLIRTVEARADDGILGSILLLNAAGTHFERAVGPSLPAELIGKAQGMAVNATPGISSLAIARGEPVAVPDFSADPKWARFAEFLAPYGLRAAWSMPIIGSGGRLLGTFANYYRHPCDPTPGDLQWVEVVARTAAIAIERARADARLLEADRRKDEFLAMLAHELRNPLAPIRSASEILSRILPDDARARSAIAVIKRQSMQLTRLVDDLLDVARITQGRIQLHNRPVDLESVIREAVESVEPQLREKQHKLTVTASTSYEPLYVDGDSTRLVQCVVNILSNAAKYTDPGGKIEVRMRAEGSSVVVEVTDTGVGISPELLPNVFDLFVQSDRTLDRAQGGLGVGLSVVKRLVEMHGGQATARSSGLGTGSTFEIRLPRVPRTQAAAPRAAIKVPPRRVLIVDDNADAADSLAELLRMQGHETHTVYSGKEALACIESFKPDVALLDIGLPEMNGYELARHLRAMPELKGMRLVALTGYGQVEDQMRASVAGFDDHLVKPVELRSLERSLAGISGHTEPHEPE